MNGNSPAFNREMKRNSTIFLIVVIVVNVGYFGWRWATSETFESCIKDAAQAANGVPRAYADLRSICDDREFERMVAKFPPPKLKELKDKDVGLFDDLIPAKPPSN